MRLAGERGMESRAQEIFKSIRLSYLHDKIITLMAVLC